MKRLWDKEEIIEIAEEHGSKGGVSQEYVDQHDEATLSSAESYTDTEVAKKQDTLTNKSVINVKQVNAESASFTGNVGVDTFANIVDNDGNTLDGSFVSIDTEQNITAKKTWTNSTYSTYVQPNAIGVKNGSSATTITSSNVTVNGMKIENGAITYDGVEFELPGTKTGSDTFAMVSDVLGKSTETWTFTLADGSTVTKTIVLGA